MIPRRQAAHRAAGHTLIELVLSLTLLSIVMASVGSAMMFAAQASPSLDGPTATIIKDAGVMNRIADDIAQAKYVLEYKSNAITVVTDDRTGDGIPDKIRYAWDGTAGDPLTYEINDSSPMTILQSVDTFELDYEIKTVITTIPPAISFGPEALISSFTSTSGALYFLSSSNYYGQLIYPLLSSDAIGFLPTRAQLYARQDGSNNGVMQVAVRDFSGITPGSSYYAQIDADESTLTTAEDWNTFTFANASVVPDGQLVSLSASHTSGSGNAASVRSNSSLAGGMIQSTNGGTSWTAVLLTAMSHRLYGKEVFKENEGFDIKRNHITSLTIALQSVATDRSPVQRVVRLYKSPELLDIFWDADFNASPTKLDMNDDKAADWYYAGGGSVPDSALAGGVWNATNSVVPVPGTSIKDLIRVDVRMRVGTGKLAMVQGPFVRDAGGQLLPLIALLMRDSDGNQQLMIYNEATPATPLITVSGLGTNWVDLHMTVLPGEQTLYLKVNDVSYGSFYLEHQADTGQRGMMLWGSAAGAEFADARITVGGSYTEVSDGSGALGAVLEGLGGLLN